MNYFYMIIFAIFLYVGTVCYIKNKEEEQINYKHEIIAEQEWEKNYLNSLRGPNNTLEGK